MLSFILYVILLAYFCAPNVLYTMTGRKGGEDDMYAFLHAIIYWILLIVSLFLFLFLQTFLVTTSIYNVDVVSIHEPAPATRAAVIVRTPPPPPSITYPIRVLDAPPPVRDITPISLPTWSWPQPTLTFPAPALPSSTPLPTFLPPVKPSSWVTDDDTTASYAPAPATGTAPSSFALAGPPNPFVQKEECIPLPPLTHRNPVMMMTSAEKVSSPPEIWNPEPLVAVFNEYNRKHSGDQQIPIVEWIQYFKPFSKNAIDKLIAVLKNKTDNE